MTSVSTCVTSTSSVSLHTTKRHRKRAQNPTWTNSNCKKSKRDIIIISDDDQVSCDELEYKRDIIIISDDDDDNAKYKDYSNNDEIMPDFESIYSNESPSLSSRLDAINLMSEHDKIMKAWTEMEPKLKPKTLKGLQSVSWLKTPTPELKRFINTIKNNVDTVGFSINYMNRLLGLIISIMESVHFNGKTTMKNNCLVLIIASRRHQSEAAGKLLRDSFQCLSQAIYGGISVRALRENLEVLCTTPGKMSELCRKGIVTKDKLKKLCCFVLDGFKEITESSQMRQQMRIVCKMLPDDRIIKVIMLETVRMNMNNGYSFMNNNGYRFMNGYRPKTVEMNNNGIGFDNVVHVIKYIENDRDTALIDILRYYCGDPCVIIFNKRTDLRKTFSLFKDRYSYYCIDSDSSNQERKSAMEALSGEHNIFRVFGTDIVASGVSTKAPILINYNIPVQSSVNKYIRRCAISCAMKVYIFSIIKYSPRRSRDKRERRSIDEQRMDKIKKCLKIKTHDYHRFSVERRKHKTARARSILIND